MKILVLNGSPKRERSDTLHITRAFLAGMEETVSTETEIVHVIDEQIGFCRGCFACKRNGGKCPQRDIAENAVQRRAAVQLSPVLLRDARAVEKSGGQNHAPFGHDYAPGGGPV